MVVKFLIMFVSKNIKKERRDICKMCPFYRDDFKIIGITIFKTSPQCKICKCSLLAKTSLEVSKCPQNKW